MTALPLFDWRQLGATLFASLFGSSVGAAFALRKHAREQWWDRKAAAYASILDSLHDIQRNADYYVGQYEGGAQFVDENPEITEAFHAANVKLDRATAQAEFLLSTQAASVLHDMREAVLGMDPNFDPPEEAAAWSEITSRYTARVIAAARIDLGVKNRWELRFRLRKLLRLK
jgi:hypothetical protein